MIKKGFSDIGIFFLNFLSLLPLSVLHFFATLSYYLLYYIVGYRKRIVRENLVNSFPEKNLQQILKIEKQYFKYLSTLMFEVIKMSSISESELRRRVKFNNLATLEAYFKNGGSVLGCTGHYCNWEWGMLALGMYMSATGYVIYKPVNNEAYGTWFNKMRTKFGNKFIPMRQTLRALVNSKDESTMFCFASDQTPTRAEARYWINFLNQPTAVLMGLEKIALQTNRPVIYFKMKLIKRGYYEIDCVSICDRPSETSEHEITDLSFKFLENLIKEEPAYWLWSHRRWKHKPLKEDKWNPA